MRKKLLALSAATCIAGAFGAGVTQGQSRPLSCEMMQGSFCSEEGGQGTCEFNGSQETMTCSGGTWEVGGGSGPKSPTTTIGTT